MHLNVEFNYSRKPISPPGTYVVIYDRPGYRASWVTHGEPGWYIGPDMENYRCQKTYITKTKASRISDTVEFLLNKFTMPKVYSADAAIHAV